MKKYDLTKPAGMAFIQSSPPLLQESTETPNNLRLLRQHVEPSAQLFSEYLELLTSRFKVAGAGFFLQSEKVAPAVSEAGDWPFARIQFLGRMHDCFAGGSHVERFCNVIKATRKGQARCERCERNAAYAAASTQCTQIYQCHAGLTDTMTPIFINGSYAGVLCIGQFLRAGYSPATFEGIWEKVKDIPGLERETLAGCFNGISVLNEKEVDDLMSRLKTATTAFTRMWEDIIEIVARESESARLHMYRVRDLAELLLYQETFPLEEAEVRAKAIGIAELPTAALAIQLDPSALDTLRMSYEERSNAMSQLISVVHEYGDSLPNTMVTSIRPGEVVILLKPAAVRNPGLRLLQLRELSHTIAEQAKQRVGVPVLVGIGSDTGDPAKVARSYKEAQRDMWLSSDDSSADPRLDPDSIAGQPRGMLPLDESEDGDPALVSWCLQALRGIGCVSEADPGNGRRMFSKTLDSILYLLNQRGLSDKEIDALRTRFSNDYDALRTYNDLSAWFQANLLPYMEETLEGPPTMAQCVVKDACALVAESSEIPTSRMEIANKLGLSDSHFGKLFYENTGLRFRDYLVLSRIAQAQKLLLDPHRSVRDVANEVGYSDPAAFTRAFSRVCGVSPSVFKKRPGVCPRVRVKQALYP